MRKQISVRLLFILFIAESLFCIWRTFVCRRKLKNIIETINCFLACFPSERVARDRSVFPERELCADFFGFLVFVILAAQRAEKINLISGFFPRLIVAAPASAANN